LAGFCNLGYAPLWGIKVTVSEIWRDDFNSHWSRLAAEGVGRYQRVNVQKRGSAGYVTQRKAHSASTAVFNASLVDKPIAELAMGALRLIGFCDNARLLVELAGSRESWLCFTKE